MNSKVVFGQYFDSGSWMHRLDPRTKILSLFLMMIGIFIINDILLLTGVFVFVILLIVSTKIPLSKFLQSLKMMLILLVFTTIFQILFNNTGRVLAEFEFVMTYFTLGISVALLILFFLSKKIVRKNRFMFFLVLVFLSLYLQHQTNISSFLFRYEVTIYDRGLEMAGFIILRIVSLIFISSLLTLTTKPTDLNNGLEIVLKPFEKIGLKTSILAMMISIALRFIPTLINEADKILKAQASRGVDFKEGKYREKIIQIISLLIPMFVVSHKRAEDLANAMEARGYAPGEKRTKLYELKYKIADVFVFIFTILFVFGGIAWRIWL